MGEQLSKSELKQQIINQAVQEYVNTPERVRSIAGISKKYGINKKTLKKYLDLNGIEINRSFGKVFNEHVFNVIDTEEKAYWLGFMYADGYIMAKTNTVGLTLSKKDLEHLLKFKQFMGWPGEISISQTHQFGTKDCHNTNGDILYVARLMMTSKYLWNDLNNHGCTPNKSLTLTFPEESMFKTKDLICPFIRGYFDGDGTLGLYPHSKTNPNLEESLMFIGTKSFLEGVQKYLGINGFLMQKSNCSNQTYRLGYSTKKAYEVAKKLYENSTIHLDRKYNIYIQQFATKNRAKTVNPETGIPC